MGTEPMTTERMGDGPRFAPMKTCRVRIDYSTEDGFGSQWALNGKSAGDPGKCMAAAADEIARLAEMFGFGDEVEAAVQKARQRVRVWLATRSQS